MWSYNQSSNEIYHYGTLGMKWGHRSALPTSDIKKRYDSAKASKKESNKTYSKEFDRVSANPLNSFTKKGSQKWNGVYKLAEKAGKADTEFSVVKAERKSAIATKANEMNKKASIGEKLLFNNATRKTAAKYVVDNNMSVTEATKRSKEDAIRNTAVFMAAYGGLLAVAVKASR